MNARPVPIARVCADCCCLASRDALASLTCVCCGAADPARALADAAATRRTEAKLRAQAAGVRAAIAVAEGWRR